MTLLTSSMAPAGAMPVAADTVKDGSAASFMADVIEGSRAVPVLVGFWAAWSAQSKQMVTLLEKTVRASKGAVRLVKINNDEHPQIAQQLRVQTVPAVYAFFQGRPVDGFMGMQPEAQIRAWIERLLRATGAAGEQNPLAELDKAFEQAEAFLAAGDGATAQAIYADILDMEPGSARAFAGIARCILATGDTDGARHFVDSAPPDIAADKALDPVRTALDLAAQAAGVGSAQDLEARLAANPADHAARFDLAMALLAGGQREQTVDHLLHIVRADRKWNDDAARQQLVKLFEAWGFADSLAIEGRRRLSTVLFS